VDRLAEHKRNTRREILAVLCLSGLVAPSLAVMMPLLPTFKDPGAGTIVLIFLVLAVLYVVGEALIGRVSMPLLTIPPFGGFARWAEVPAANGSGRWRKTLYVACLLAFYWSIGLLAAIALYRSGVIPRPSGPCGGC
jgi:hypothetical protein